MQGIQPIGERRRPRLQDDGRLDLVELSISHRGNVCPARSRRPAFRSKILAGPRAADAIHIRDDARHSSMIAVPYLESAFEECLCDISLDVGEANHEIRFKPNDVIDPGTGEGRHLGLFSPRSSGAHGESGNAYDT